MHISRPHYSAYTLNTFSGRHFVGCHHASKLASKQGKDILQKWAGYGASHELTPVFRIGGRCGRARF
jgi:hypothetical protein